MGQRLYNANDGVTGRDGGPYLDEVEVIRAEERRALVEDREPDYDNPPATAGIQLNSAAQMMWTVDVNRPSATAAAFDEAEARFGNAADDDKTNLRVFAEIPDDALTNKKADEVQPSAEELKEADENTDTLIFQGGNPPTDSDKGEATDTENVGNETPNTGNTEPPVDSSKYDDMLVGDLQTELGKRGLTKTGNKDELIARLKDADQSSASA